MKNKFEVRGDFTVIHCIKYKTGKQYEVLIDTEDLQQILDNVRSIVITDYLDQGKLVYAMCVLEDRKRIQLHRLIMKTPKDLVVDHIDRNGLNNCKENLRNCTREQNAQNRELLSKNKTGYRGVMKRKYSHFKKPYEATVCINKERHSLGFFETAEEAGKAAKEFRLKHMPYAVD